MYLRTGKRDKPKSAQRSGANRDLNTNIVRCGERLLLEIGRLPRSAHGGYLASNAGQVKGPAGASPGLLLETKP